MNWIKSMLIFVVFFLLCSSAIAGVIEATTKEGKKVILSTDGTWSYRDTEKKLNTVPVTSSTVFKGKNGAYELWYDDNIWVNAILS